jgi:hypothetical protein
LAAGKAALTAAAGGTGGAAGGGGGAMGLAWAGAGMSRRPARRAPKGADFRTLGRAVASSGAAGAGGWASTRAPKASEATR